MTIQSQEAKRVALGACDCCDIYAAFERITFDDGVGVIVCDGCVEAKCFDDETDDDEDCPVLMGWLKT